jgi:hypothetical protein
MDCKCNVQMWMSYGHNNERLIRIVKCHFYNHVMTYFISLECSTIVRQYVGIIPLYEHICMCKSVWNDYNVYEYCYKTLGHPCLDNGDKRGFKHIISYFNNTCRVINCGLPILKDNYCEEHHDQWTTQWYDQQITFVHKHDCKECFVAATHILCEILNAIFPSVLSTYIIKLCNDLYKCKGHNQQRRYECDRCCFID